MHQDKLCFSFKCAHSTYEVYNQVSAMHVPKTIRKYIIIKLVFIALLVLCYHTSSYIQRRDKVAPAHNSLSTNP